MLYVEVVEYRPVFLVVGAGHIGRSLAKLGHFLDYHVAVLDDREDFADPALLRASHIVPWADCGDEQRLDVHNGLLLSALWDAAFDKGLISFADDGQPLVSPLLSDAALAALSVDAALPINRLRDAHCVNLKAHRARYGF